MEKERESKLLFIQKLKLAVVTLDVAKLIQLLNFVLHVVILTKT